MRYGFIGNSFSYHSQINFDSIWSCEGQINIIVKIIVSFQLAIQDMPYVVLCTGLEYLAKMEEKLSQHDIASYTAKRYQLVLTSIYSISVNWAVGGVCKVFACLLRSYRASFGTELLIAALITVSICSRTCCE